MKNFKPTIAIILAFTIIGGMNSCSDYHLNKQAMEAEKIKITPVEVNLDDYLVQQETENIDFSTSYTQEMPEKSR